MIFLLIQFIFILRSLWFFENENFAVRAMFTKNADVLEFNS